MTLEDLQAAARDGYVFGYAMVENYRTLYAQAVDAADPRYVGGFGVYRHYPEPARPENTDIVTPNNDTPYSWAWLDLRAEPWVVTVPAISRYYILPFHDLYTIYAGFVGAVTTGPGAGSYLVAGPHWSRELPEGVSGVIRASTEFVGTLSRVELTSDGVDSLRSVQSSIRLQPLSDFSGTDRPLAPDHIDWPVWDEDGFTKSARFFELVDFLLQFSPPLPEDEAARAQLAVLGVTGSGRFSLKQLDSGAIAAIAAGIADGAGQLDQLASTTATSIGLFGTREQMAGKYRERDLGAMKGIFGLPASEAWYGGWLQDGNGEHLLGSRGYTVTFSADQLPSVSFFWSATMYRLPQRLLVANPIDRYSIGDRTKGLVYADDDSLTLTFAHDRPEDPTASANWLPAPAGPFTVIIRGYGGDERMTTGTYQLPPLIPMS